MTARKLICCLALMMSAVIATTGNAAVVSFLGSVNTGKPGTLGSLPRDFKLVLNYNVTGLASSPVIGTMTFPATPNANTTNPNTHPTSIIPLTGSLSVSNNFMGSDIFTFGGFVDPGLLGTKAVNFNFAFLNPTTTISTPVANPTTIAALISGQTAINFSGGGGVGTFGGAGVIRGAPEPSTMIALTGLVAGGCGIGYRRRLKKAQQASTEGDS